MSLICVYLLAKTLIFRNEHFQLVFKLKTILLKIRAHTCTGPPSGHLQSSNFYLASWVHSHAPSIRSHRGIKVVWPDFQPMRVPEEPVCVHLFWQKPVFTSLHLKSPVHVHRLCTLYSVQPTPLICQFTLALMWPPLQWQNIHESLPGSGTKAVLKCIQPMSQHRNYTNCMVGVPPWGGGHEREISNAGR